LDFTGNELNVQLDPNDPSTKNDFDIKGMFLEGYSPKQPPDSLRLPPV